MTASSKNRSKRKTVRRKKYNKKGGEKWDVPFQSVINFVGSKNVLEEFLFFLGREKAGFIAKKPKEEQRATRQVKVPPGFTGLAYDGAHWKGYEDGNVVYDSYASGIQVPRTNNFCQSYAGFLYASRGLANKKHGVALVPGDYANNVKKISLLWLKFFDYMETRQGGHKWLVDSSEGIPGGIELIIATLRQLSADDAVAAEFSASKEG
jgi:hypothetical protein